MSQGRDPSCALGRAHQPWGVVRRLGQNLAVSGLLAANMACAAPQAVRFGSASEPLVVRQEALYPETVVYDERAGVFLVSSLRDGAIYAVDAQGAVTKKLGDQRLCSVLGFAVDESRRRLWAVNADLGVSLRPSDKGPKQLARVVAYDLDTGALVHDLDLGALAPGPHLPNGLAVEPVTGSVFVTDSFEPVIYRVDATGAATVFLRDPALQGEGVALNGVVVHPDGYLLVVKKSDGALFKVPLAEPQRFSRVNGAGAFVGGDGLMLVGKNELVLVANKTPQLSSDAVYDLTSADAWVTARLRAVHPLGDVYPTTSVLRGRELFVLTSKLNELLQAPAAERAGLRRAATLISVGRISP